MEREERRRESVRQRQMYMCTCIDVTIMLL